MHVSKKDMSIARGDEKDSGAHDTAGVSAWNAPYISILGVGLRGSIDSMHVAGAS
jgi:hypothetical protein